MVDEVHRGVTTGREGSGGGASEPTDTASMLMQEHEDLLARRRLLGQQPANPSAANGGANRKPGATAASASATTSPSTESYNAAAHAIGDISALCLSGGGIRSAAFGLGVLQGLARLKLLHRFDYLSTVSGGGYIGGWLTSWVHRHLRGYAGVVVDLASNREPERQSPLAHLWRYSNFLTPHTGILSSDTLTAVVLYLRNLLLNWLVIVPFVIGAIIIVKLFAIAAGRIEAGWVGAFAVAAMTSIGWALLDSLRQRPGWETRTSNRFRFFATELLPLAAGGLLASVALIKYYDIFKDAKDQVPGWTVIAIHLGIGGGVLCLVAWLFAFYFTSLSVQPPTRAPGQDEPSVTTTVAAAAGQPGDLKHVVWAAVSFTIAGAVTGVLLATIVALLSGTGSPIEWLKISPEDVRAFLVLCFGLPLVLLAIFLGEVIYAGLTSYAPWGEAEREWLARAAARHAFAAGVWMSASVLVLFGSIAIFALENEYQKKAVYFLASSGGTAGAIVALLGKASTTTAQLKARAMSWTDRSLNTILLIGTVVFVVCAVALLSAGFDWVALGGYPLRLHTKPDYWPVLMTCVGMILLGSLFSLFVNVNRFSLHGMYRDRIIRAFLGASRRTRAPNPFTGFDQHDNVQLESLWPNTSAEPGKLPPQILVVNMALNVLHFDSDPRGTSELAWQERKALPFTASARFVGSGNLEWGNAGNRVGCFRSAAAYARGARLIPQDDTDQNPAGHPVVPMRWLRPRMFRAAAEALAKNRKGLSLGTALTLSGAAASPNMGYHSSPALSVLLTLFNVRLGGWYGNPGPAGSDSFWRVGPAVAVKPLLYEALGLADDHRPFVYLSDGGHFENLGVYEMIRRRCHYIVVSDAGCDPKCNLEDLGNLVRKVSVDFGVKIDFGARLNVMARQTPPAAGSYAAIADIIYPERPAQPGKLLYIKPGFHGSEPASARSYGFMHPEFPHEPTSDQWFGESQFEAYRALGEHVIEAVIGSADFDAGDGVAGFVNACADNLTRQGRARDERD